MNVNKLIEIFKEEYKEITALNEPMMCFVDINEIKCLTDEIERLNNIINELEKWLKMLPKCFMDKRSFNTGVYIEQGMQKQIDLTLDKLKELKGSVNNE